MQIVTTDILGPLPITPNGNSYLLVASDYFTRWVEAYPIPNQEATTIANKLTQELFFRFSLPDQLHSDQGRQFESVFLKFADFYRFRNPELLLITHREMDW